MDPIVLKRKVCLVGEQAVGKTSLIRRFVLGVFDDRYIATLGAVVRKKSVLVTVGGRETAVDLTVLDIMGRTTFMELFGHAYFSGAAGIVAVFDLTREETLKALPTWIEGVQRNVGSLPTMVFANKADLEDDIAVSDKDIREVLRGFDVTILRTSARTGSNVEDGFSRLAVRVAENSLAAAPPP